MRRAGVVVVVVAVSLASSCAVLRSFVSFDRSVLLQSNVFAWELRVIDDLDGDGMREFVVLDPEVVYMGSRAGAVTTHDGRTLAMRARDGGPEAVQRHGPWRENAFARARPLLHGEDLEPSRAIWVDVADVGDLDGDGAPDVVLAISDPDTTPPLDAQLRAVSGAQNTMLWARTFEVSWRYVPHARLCLVAWDDWNADGARDCLVGFTDFADERSRGTVHVIDSRSGATLARVE